MIVHDHPFDASVIVVVRPPIYGPEQTDPETGETWRPVTGYRDGYHVNIARRYLTEALAAYEVDPEPHTPVTEWAGETQPQRTLAAFLRFADEAQALTVLAAWRA